MTDSDYTTIQETTVGILKKNICEITSNDVIDVVSGGGGMSGHGDHGYSEDAINFHVYFLRLIQVVGKGSN
jgi:hypothetical protein